MRLTLQAVLFTCLLSTVANAYQTRVLDQAGVISANDASLLALRSDLPFTTKVQTGTYSTRTDLESVTSGCVDAPEVVCIGLDPIHRWVSVHFGTGTGVPHSMFAQLARAGNASFKQGSWSRGIQDIQNATLAAVEQAQAPKPQPVVYSTTTPVVLAIANKKENESPMSHDVGWFMWFLFVAAVAFVLWCIYKLSTRVKKQEEVASSLREERDEYLDANVKRMTDPIPTPAPKPAPAVAPAGVKSAGVTPGVPKPAPAAAKVPPAPVIRPAAPIPAPRPVISSPVVHHHHHDNDLAVGILIGQSRPAAPVVVVEREASSKHSRRSDDDGGSGSSWSSSSSSSSSSYDSGGSSSDFGGGSGGGFDSGGSGSDF